VRGQVVKRGQPSASDRRGLSSTSRVSLRAKRAKTSSPSISEAGYRGLTTQSGWCGHGDDILLLTALVLTAAGLVMVYSASLFVATSHAQVDWFFFGRQSRFLIVALLALLVGMWVDVRHYRHWGTPFLIGVSLLMVLQLTTPIGYAAGGTRRWVRFGLFNLQTSDVARCLVVIFLAKVLTDRPEIVRRFPPDGRLIKVLALVAVPLVLTCLQPDLSGALMMALIAGLLFFIGGLRLRYLAGFGLAAVPTVALLAFRTPYQRERVLGFIGRLSDGTGDNYQSLQSLIGFGRGGILGVGLGQGKQKMLFLPEPHTDFIFSIIGEELGLIGAIGVLLAFLVLFVRAFRICLKQTDRFNFLLGCGLIGSILLFSLVNMGVAVGVLPVTGLPLPFISSGGTSLVVSLWSVGVLWNLSRRIE